MGVPFLRSRVVVSRLWDFLELLDQFPEADLEKTIPMQMICYKSAPGETSMGKCIGEGKKSDKDAISCMQSQSAWRQSYWKHGLLHSCRCLSSAMGYGNGNLSGSCDTLDAEAVPGSSLKMAAGESP